MRAGPRQGISVAWTDLYDNTLDGQTLRLPAAVRDGDTESWVVLADPEGNEFCVVRPTTSLIA